MLEILQFVYDALLCFKKGHEVRFDTEDIVDQYTRNLCEESYEESEYTEIEMEKKALDEAVSMLVNSEDPCIVSKSIEESNKLVEMIAQKN